ncbi:hypothetical protein MKX03_004013 [Papaver bracteatum]|nr:hypothetical protein MKX03_004013 [Papaver bracteatum]
MDVKTMESFVDGYSDILLQFTLFTLAKQEYGYRLYKFYRLKSAKLSLLLEQAHNDRDFLNTQMEDLKKQVETAGRASAEEMELLRRQLTQSQNSIAAAELARDVAVRACELAEQARAAADTSCTRESAEVLVLQEQIAGLTKKVDDLNAEVIKQTNLVSDISGHARTNETRAEKA